MTTPARTRAQNKWIKAARDRIVLVPTKAEGARIRSAAAAAGLSVNAYILEAVRARMAAEGVKGSDDGDGPPI